MLLFITLFIPNIFLIVIGLILIGLIGSAVTTVQESKKQRKDIEIRFKEQTLTFEKKESDYKLKMFELAQVEFEKFKSNELAGIKKMYEESAFKLAENLTAEWIEKNNNIIREDSRKRSYAANVGKMIEHFLPFDPEHFKFNPKDARFIGNPIDMIIFDGYSENKPSIKIFFLEIKSGGAKLNEPQQKIKQAVKDRAIEWLEIYVDTSSGGSEL